MVSSLLLVLLPLVIVFFWVVFVTFPCVFGSLLTLVLGEVVAMVLGIVTCWVAGVLFLPSLVFLRSLYLYSKFSLSLLT